MGARMFRAGRLPYRDFYTHYGPLGYAALAPVLSAVRNFGVALRLAQAVTLAALAVLLLGALRRGNGARPVRADAAVPLAVLALSPAIALASFEGFGFAAATLLFYTVARAAGDSGRRVAAVLGGVMLAATLLTRPAFAAYAAAAILAAELAGRGDLTPRSSTRRLVFFLLTGAAAVLALWVLFFREIPPSAAVEATLTAPARLIESGGRAIRPDFMSAPFPAPILLGGILAAVPLFWWFSVRRGARILAMIAIAVGALTPALFARSDWPPGRLAALAILQFGLTAAIALRSAPALRDSPRLWSAALFGLGASAFGHYFWSRPDQQHLFPLLALGAISAAFAFDRFGPAGRLVLVGVLAAAFVPVGPGRESGLPAASLWNGGWARVRENAARPGARPLSIWPSGEVPSHAAAAVALADRLGGPSSRFVAFGSSQSWSSGNPVYLFLLSSRLPYTKWYAYDPGLQSSAPIQALMIQDLESSGSLTAVVWRAEQFLYDERAPADLELRSAFDREADQLFGRVIERFGNYEVRARFDPAATGP